MTAVTTINQYRQGLGVALCGALILAFAGCKEKKEDTRVRFEIDKVYQRGPLTAHVRVDKGKITIAETLLLEFETAVEPGYKVRPPKVEKALENFGLVDWRNCGTWLDPNDNIVSRYQYKLEPFLSGKYKIPAFTFEFYDVNDPNGKTYKLSSEPIDVEVTSLLGRQRSELTIGDIEDVVEMQKASTLWWLWLVVPIGAVVSVILWVLLRRRRSKQLARVFEPAHEIAYERLRALIAEELIKSGRVKEFYERISNILRHYIEDRFDLRAPERTTEEFLAELQWTDSLSAPDKQCLAEFLQHCDLVKFARYNPTDEQIQRTFDIVKTFIEKTRSEEQKIDVTDQVEDRQAIKVESS